jgi:uncharacterized membrane protein YtjA (UPF0391 family)
MGFAVRAYRRRSASRSYGSGINNPQPLGDHHALWAAVFFIVALIAAVLGFGGIAAGAAGIAKILFFIFLVAFVVSAADGASSAAESKELSMLKPQILALSALAP